MEVNNILVVCTGNICRSPMAKALLQICYPQKRIDSAGLAAVVGHPIQSEAVEVMTAAQIDIDSHCAKQITKDMAVAADLILTMTSKQTKWIESKWPYCRGKTFRLGHWNNKDINDPYGHNLAAFKTAYQDIADSLGYWQNKLAD